MERAASWNVPSATINKNTAGVSSIKALMLAGSSPSDKDLEELFSQMEEAEAAAEAEEKPVKALDRVRHGMQGALGSDLQDKLYVMQ